MAKIDWTITGTGGQSVVTDAGSKRLQLSYTKLMLWSARNNLVDSEVVGDVKVGDAGSSNSSGGFVLRSDSNMSNCYRLLIVGNRTYYVQKIVAGVVTTLASTNSSQPWSYYATTRFRVDGYQLSVDEYSAGVWNNIIVALDTTQSVPSGYTGLLGNSVNSSYWIYFDNIIISER